MSPARGLTAAANGTREKGRAVIKDGRKRVQNLSPPLPACEPQTVVTHASAHSHVEESCRSVHLRTHDGQDGRQVGRIVESVYDCTKALLYVLVK